MTLTERLKAMTYDELRDWVATQVDGGAWRYQCGRWYHKKWHKLGSGQLRHPIDDTLDAVAALWPDGWVWERRYVYFEELGEGDDECVLCLTTLLPNTTQGPVVRDTGNEKHDRLLLACLCRAAMKEKA